MADEATEEPNPLHNRRRTDLHHTDRSLRPFHWHDLPRTPAERLILDRRAQLIAEKSLTGETD